MRLFLDAHISGPRIAIALRKAGHDVRAADEDRSLDGWSDEALLELAADDSRVMVTFNVADFARIVSDWAGGGRHHGGCLLVARIQLNEFGLIIRRLCEVLDGRPGQDGWRDLTYFVTRSS